MNKKKKYKIGFLFVTLFILVLPTITLATETSIMRRTSSTCYQDGNCELNNILEIAVSLYQDIFKIYLVPATLLFVVIAGLRFVLSQGDSEKIKGAKNMLVAAVIGLLIALASFLIIDFTLKQTGIVDESGNFLPSESATPPANEWSSSPE
jgi:hypothetical protein